MKSNTSFFRILFLAAVSFFLATSCRVSAPRTQHVPLFEEKGEMQIAANINTNVGAELQFDYAVGDRTYLMTDFSRSLTELNDAFGSANAYYGSLGVGRFRTYGKYGRFSYYGGGTLGKINYINNSDIHLSPFLGVDWGMARPKFETALSFKFSQNWITDEGQYFTYEPAWTMRFGGERLKFQSQFGLVLQQGDGGFGHYSATFGFTYRLRTINE